MFNLLHRNAGGLAAEFNSGKGLGWFDDFDSPLSQWSPFLAYEGNPNVSNSDVWMLAANVSVSNSIATITIKQESSNGRNYTSGKLSTNGRKSIYYGRIDVRVRWCYGSGLWSGIWMMPHRQHYGAWPG